MSQSKAQLTNPFGTVNITDGVNVSGVITATTLVGDGTALTGIALTGNINTSGIITASEFYGYGGSLSNVGLGTEDSINTTGIITAGQFYGDGSLLTNIGGAFAPLTFNPTNGQTNVGLTTNIVITFNKPIQAGVGTITLRTDSATGTIVESYDISSSDRLTISAGTLTIDPTDSLSGLTTYFTVIPAGVLQDTYGVDSNTAIDTYSFTTVQLNYELYTQGSNGRGELLTNDIIARSSPIQIPGTQWSDVATGFQFTLAVKNDGTLWGAGKNIYGTIGLNDKIQYSSPVQVPGTQWSEVFSFGNGQEAVLSRKTDGTLWAWGTNDYGNLGQNNKTRYSSPTQIPGTQWNYISPGGGCAMGTKTDGTLWAWGFGGNGELAQNNLTPQSSPVQIPGTQWNKISNGVNYTLASKTDGTLWAWGYNYVGLLGLNDYSTARSSPTQIPGTQWNELINNFRLIGMATKTDGTLWAWGKGNVGSLGQNNLTYYSSPVQIPGTQWGIISSSTYGVGILGTKTDGTLWAWGGADIGHLGLNDTAPRSSPTQIPGTQWNISKIDQGPYYSVYISVR